MLFGRIYLFQDSSRFEVQIFQFISFEFAIIWRKLDIAYGILIVN